MHDEPHSAEHSAAQFHINAEQLLNYSRSVFLEHSAAMLLIEPASGRILDANPAACRYYGYSHSEFICMNIQDVNVLPVRTVDLLRGQAFRKSREVFIFPHRLKNGEIRMVEVHSSPLGSEPDSILCSIILDITMRDTAYEQLEQLNTRDYLTGAYNRRFYEAKKLELGQTGPFPLSILVGDINGVRLINESYGNAAGDQLIIDTANILRHCLREDDILARMGGGEFCVLMPGTDQNSADSILRKIDQACHSGSFAESDSKTDPAKTISFSLGFGTCQSPADSLNQMELVAKGFMRKRKLLDGKSHLSSTINSMLASLDAKSHETEDHSKRIAFYCMKIGQLLGLSTGDLDRLQLLSLLHDIGKIGVPDQVLNKPGRLTDDDWVLMRQHCQIGHNIAISVPELEGIASYILSHHERWDGGGYPQGLKGDSIPLLSRILALVDSYDAMTSNRVYRKALPRETAMQEILDNAGTQFDPKLATLFVKQVLPQALHLI